MNVVQKKIDLLIPYVNNAKIHHKEQIKKIAASIKEFGFNNPILVDAKNGIIAGHGRLEAAKILDMKEVPTICLDHLSDAQKKAYIMMELDPHYCDVIIKRWQNFTGKEAVREDGAKFNEQN